MGATLRVPKHIDLLEEISKPLDASDTEPFAGESRLENCRREIARVRKVIREFGIENGIEADSSLGSLRKK